MVGLPWIDWGMISETILDCSDGGIDPVAEAHYNYFRDYDPAIGRYVQSDPLGIDAGLSTFSFAGNRPTLAVDPNGLAIVVPIPNFPPPPPQPGRDRNPFPLPDFFPKPPGDCAPSFYNHLKRDVDEKCKPNPGNCLACESCAGMSEKASKHFGCAAARKKMNDTCFRGGNPSHQAERVFRLYQGYMCIGFLPTCVN